MTTSVGRPYDNHVYPGAESCPTASVSRIQLRRRDRPRRPRRPCWPSSWPSASRGWVGPTEHGWVVLVCRRLARPVTAEGHDLDGTRRARCRVTAGGPALAVDVHRDRVLRLAMWHGPDEVGRYLSNPALGAGRGRRRGRGSGARRRRERGGLRDGLGTAEPDAHEEVAETLGELLDEEEQTESERLWAVLRLLGCRPGWSPRPRYPRTCWAGRSPRTSPCCFVVIPVGGRTPPGDGPPRRRRREPSLAPRRAQPTTAKARTGNDTMPSIRGGAAVKRNPFGGSASSPVRFSTIGTPAAEERPVRRPLPRRPATRRRC